MDAGILEQVLSHIHNWFDHGQIGLSGCAISEGRLPASISIPEGAWYRIQGSLFNDGLHKHPADDLTDETFDGTITVCAVPKALLEVVDEIEEWVDLNKAARQRALESPYASESFDGYSYSIRSDLTAQNGSGGLTGWQAEFASRLNAWRKVG
jgi:hypothetical protein